jgi:hypothetical protein
MSTTAKIVFDMPKSKTIKNWRLTDIGLVGVSLTWTINCKIVNGFATVTEIHGDVSDPALHRLADCIQKEYPEVIEVDFKY